MELRPLTNIELALWAAYRRWCLSAGRDPGAAPEQWPADSVAAERVSLLLLDAIANDVEPPATELLSLLPRKAAG